MAKTEPKNRGSAGQKSDGPQKSKGIRTSDDLELLKMILDANPKLRSRVLYVLEVALGKRESED